MCVCVCVCVCVCASVCYPWTYRASRLKTVCNDD